MRIHKVLIVQSDLESARVLTEYFKKTGVDVLQTTSVSDAHAILLHSKSKPSLIIVDLHLPYDGWLPVVETAQSRTPQVKIIITNRYPDLRRELQARERGIQVFLRQPYTRQWIERALVRLEEPSSTDYSTAALKAIMPPVRIPVRLKITLPFVLLSLVFVVAAAWLVSNYVLQSIEQRFRNQLLDSRRLTANWMVTEEDRLLATLRLIANTQAVPEAVAAENADQLRQLILPTAINAAEEAVEILDHNGVSVLSLRHVSGGPLEEYTATRGENIFTQWEAVQKVLGAEIDQRGDKYAQLALAPWGNYFYVVGPILNDEAQLVGAVLVGKSLSTLADEMQNNTHAYIAFYDLSGQPLAAALPLDQIPTALTSEEALTVLAEQDQASLEHTLRLDAEAYREIIAPWEARGGKDLGLLGTILAPNYLTRILPGDSQWQLWMLRLQAFLIIAAGFALVVLVGFYTASRITRPLQQMVRTSAEVAQGNLDVKIQTQGNDEVAALAYAFNYMVSGLQEGSIYRDLLGRTVSPEVREELRRTFASGDLRLEGQNAQATVLISDVQGFTALSEKQEPTTVLRWLNEYFSELVPAIMVHGGVVDKFEGDAILAFFGILPRLLSPQESAAQACQAALDMLLVIERLNAIRQQRHEPPLSTGIGINTGTVTAGGLGAADRLNYTIIGDTVNTTQRLESFTRAFGESGIVISAATYIALGDKTTEFKFQSLGEQSFKGKSEKVLVYRLLPN